MHGYHTPAPPLIPYPSPLFWRTGADPEADRQGAEDSAGYSLRQGLLGEDHQLAGDQSWFRREHDISSARVEVLHNPLTRLLLLTWGNASREITLKSRAQSPLRQFVGESQAFQRPSKILASCR